MKFLRAMLRLCGKALHPRNALPCVGLVVLGGSVTFLVAPDEIPALHATFLNEGLPVIVLDAGHGGRDVGGRGNGLVEKDLTLDIALRSEKLLKMAGFPTVLTRKDDSYVSLRERARIANEHDEALFVSIHLNKDSARSSNGMETYYAKNKVPLEDDWTWIGFFSQPDRLHNIEDCEHLAGSIQAAIATRTEGRNRGIRQRNYYVVRHVKGPAVLVEGGFMSNSLEAKLLETEDYRERLAMGIAEGVMNYQRSKGQPASKPPQLASAGR